MAIVKTSSPDKFVYESELPATAAEVIGWHKRDGAFERLAPPWLDVAVLERNGGIENGGTVTLAMKKGPATLKWYLAHRDFEEGHQFCDYQIRGPFQEWEQSHRADDIVNANGTSPSSSEGLDRRSVLTDAVNFKTPLYPVGQVGVPIIKSELNRLFRFRHRLLLNDLKLSKQHNTVTPLKFLISGSSGLIGRNLIPLLLTQGHSVTRLVRQTTDDKPVVLTGRPDQEAKIDWLNISELEGFDVIIHLGGENLATNLWSEKKKNEFVSSRVDSTHALVEAINKLAKPPKVFLCASAIGFYGDRGNDLVSEESPEGLGFLADLCKSWEAATRTINSSVRVCNLRIGLVLSPKGGALQKLLPPFQMGIGGALGNGQQYMSWISIEDVIASIYHCAISDAVSGPVNLVSPEAVSNSQFSKTLARVLHRPALVKLPKSAVRATFGELADECLLSGCRVIPEKLLQSEYRFRDSNLEDALRNLLGLG